MKKIKLFILAIASILLPSCTNNPSPAQENNITENNDENANRLYNLEPESNINTSYTPERLKFPASGKNISGEINPLPDEAENIDSNTDYLDNENELLGSYSSKVYTKTEDRQKNLRIVCEKLSGTIIAPNEEFSYNETCGPYNKANGFGKATVFLGDGSEKQDYGGGVCQLSSTLYNAVKNLNVDITERHNHSKKVYYVPEGDDATVSYGHLDFKFKNLNDYSLLIEAVSNSETVDVYVYKV